MAGVIKKTLQLLTGTDDLSVLNPFRMRPTLRQLVQKESELGGGLFGQVPLGHHRQFFNLDANTWVWYEEWTDADGVVQSTTTRYEIHEKGILKVQDGSPYYYLDKEELSNLVTAIQMYYERVTREIYHRDPVTGNPLTV